MFSTLRLTLFAISLACCSFSCAEKRTDVNEKENQEKTTMMRFTIKSNDVFSKGEHVNIQVAVKNKSPNPITIPAFLEEPGKAPMFELSTPEKTTLTLKQTGLFIRDIGAAAAVIGYLYIDQSSLGILLVEDDLSPYY